MGAELEGGAIGEDAGVFVDHLIKSHDNNNVDLWEDSSLYSECAVLLDEIENNTNNAMFQDVLSDDTVIYATDCVDENRTSETLNQPASEIVTENDEPTMDVFSDMLATADDYTDLKTVRASNTMINEGQTLNPDPPFEDETDNNVNMANFDQGDGRSRPKRHNIGRPARYRD